MYIVIKDKDTIVGYYESIYSFVDIEYEVSFNSKRQLEFKRFYDVGKYNLYTSDMSFSYEYTKDEALRYFITTLQFKNCVLSPIDISIFKAERLYVNNNI